MTTKLLNVYSLVDHLQGLEEECGELITAISKYKRANRISGYRANVTPNFAMANLVEEIADVENTISAVITLLGISRSELQEITRQKDARAEARLVDNYDCAKMSEEEIEGHVDGGTNP